MKIHLVIDRVTGQVNAQGRSGRIYSQAELEAAEEGARKGEPLGQAALDDINVEGVENPQILNDQELEAALADVLGARWRRRPRGRR